MHVAENLIRWYKTEEFNARYMNAQPIKYAVVTSGETWQMYIYMPRALYACFSSETLSACCIISCYNSLLKQWRFDALYGPLDAGKVWKMRIFVPNIRYRINICKEGSSNIDKYITNTYYTCKVRTNNM